MRKRYQAPAIASSEITSESTYLKRRELIKAAGLAALPAFAGSARADEKDTGGIPLDYTAAAEDGPAGVYTSESQTPLADVKSYCNFYEFGMDKGDPARNAHEMTTDPWSISVSGAVNKPGKLNLEDILSGFDLEERIYRFRCVEAWSMVVPWVGFPLGELLKRFEPTSDAKFVSFKTLHDPKRMPGQKRAVLRWPYREGLTIAEAMHPLTLMVVGIYGKALPNQNGAPLRLVVPWKYGFKGIKSIVEIEFTKRQPPTSWELAAPREYGFYANVNPEVSHPRWSQARERRIGAGLFAEKQPTLMFNGYADEVAELYAGLDLRKNY